MEEGRALQGPALSQTFQEINVVTHSAELSRVTRTGLTEELPKYPTWFNTDTCIFFPGAITASYLNFTGKMITKLAALTQKQDFCLF